MYKVYEFTSKEDLEIWLIQNEDKEYNSIIGFSVRQITGYEFAGISSTFYSILVKK